MLMTLTTKTLRIGPFVYSVVPESFEESEKVDLQESGEFKLVTGMHRSNDLKITYFDGLVPARAVQTVWHEIGHAVLECAGVNGEHDEAYIEAFTHGFLQVMVDNREFVRESITILDRALDALPGDDPQS